MAYDDIKSNSPPNNVFAAEEWNDFVSAFKNHQHNGSVVKDVVFPSTPDPTPSVGEVYYKTSDKSLQLYDGAWQKLLKEGNIIFFGRVTGRYYTTIVESTALTTGAPTANNLRAMPFVVVKKITLDRIAINVTTLSAGNARIGIYDDLNGYPNNRLADSGDLATGSTGLKEANINVILEQGLYWLVHVGSVAPTLRCLPVANCIPTLGFDNTLATAPAVGYTVAFSYAALPDTYPGSATYITSVPIPGIFVRIA